MPAAPPGGRSVSSSARFSSGKHWTSDIPRLTAEAAEPFPATQFHVTPTLGIDDLILDLLAKRIAGCEAEEFDCDTCRGTLRIGKGNAELR
jgi:sirohydrochlorin ferrochelatase